jgi:ASC-1-like (ASCH) protein
MSSADGGAAATPPSSPLDFQAWTRLGFQKTIDAFNRLQNTLRDAVKKTREDLTLRLDGHADRIAALEKRWEQGPVDWAHRIRGIESRLQALETRGGQQPPPQQQRQPFAVDDLQLQLVALSERLSKLEPRPPPPPVESKRPADPVMTKREQDEMEKALQASLAERQMAALRQQMVEEAERKKKHDAPQQQQQQSAAPLNDKTNTEERQRAMRESFSLFLQLGSDIPQQQQQQQAPIGRLHRLELHREFFDQMRRREKIYEGRCRWKAALEYKEGDVFDVYPYQEPNSKDNFRAKIVKIHTFRSFREALTSLPLNKILPGVASVDQGCDIYRRFVSDATAEQHGVLMIEVHVR